MLSTNKFNLKEKLFILFACLSGMLIAAEYGITRPASNAIFLSYFSSKAYPWVWLTTVPLNLLVVYFYNSFLSRLGPLRMFFSLIVAVIFINVFCAFFLTQLPYLAFFQYAWKDIYILLMFKQLWSMIHSTISASRAKYLYGFIFGMGTVGSILGSLIPGFLAIEVGSERLFFFTAPLHLMLWFTYKWAFKKSSLNEISFHKDLTEDHRPSEGFALIYRSPFLISVLLLVIFMQISVGLMEYQFNFYLETNILDKDMRTQYYGRLVGVMNLMSVFLQFMGGFLMLYILGLKNCHFAIPAVLCLEALFLIIAPSFAMISFSYVFLKSIDFSLFGVLREMLYIPLKLDEKFRAKAVIDVFGYRTSKAVVALLILCLQVYAGTRLLSSISYLSVGVFLAWIIVVIQMFNLKTAVEDDKLTRIF